VAEEDFASTQRYEVAMVEVEVGREQRFIDSESFVAQIAQHHSHRQRLKR
jgi:hypothetical protein